MDAAILTTFTAPPQKQDLFLVTKPIQTFSTVLKRLQLRDARLSLQLILFTIKSAFTRVKLVRLEQCH